MGFIQRPKTLKPLLHKSDHPDSLRSEKPYTMWSDTHRLDSYEMSGNKKKRKKRRRNLLSCVWIQPVKENCLARSCISTESWGLIWRAVLNLSGSRGRRAGERAGKSICEWFWTLQSSRNRSGIMFHLPRQSWPDSLLNRSFSLGVCACVSGEMCVERTYSGKDGNLFHSHMHTHTCNSAVPLSMLLHTC